MKKEMISRRLRNLSNRLAIIEKSKKYVESELAKLRQQEKVLRDKISKEKKAISLVARAKKLR